MDQKFEIIRYAHLEPQRWRNNAGTTREIVRDTPNPDWNWRISIADVVHDAEFSVFPGIDRILVLLEGEGIRLRFDDGRTLALSHPFAVACFEGEAPLRGAPMNGATRDFNLMWRRSRVSTRFEVTPFCGPMLISAAPDVTCVVHVAEGEFTLLGTGEHLKTGDTLVLNAARGPYQLHGSATLFLARMMPLQAASGAT